MLTQTNQGTVFALLHLIFGKRFSPGRLVSRSEGRLQAHHDVLHHSRAGASIQESGCEKRNSNFGSLEDVSEKASGCLISAYEAKGLPEQDGLTI